MFKKLCIIGVGLIGGSIARAARLKQPNLHIVGYGRAEDLENLRAAQALGVIDAYTVYIADAVAEADCVVLAIPVGAYASLFKLLKPYWSPKTLYTDAGSTKGSVIAACVAEFGVLPSNFVPAHPIAGAEQSGVTAAKADLFQHKGVIITPESNTDPEAVVSIQCFWEGLGAKVTLMDAVQHDAILAATSHLPHVLAFALVDLLGHKDEQADLFHYAAGGFKDFTRIASSDPTMWLDICMANKQQLIPLLEQMKSALTTIQQHLIENDSQQLISTFTYANITRQRFLNHL